MRMAGWRWQTYVTGRGRAWGGGARPRRRAAPRHSTLLTAAACCPARPPSCPCLVQVKRMLEDGHFSLYAGEAEQLLEQARRGRWRLQRALAAWRTPARRSAPQHSAALVPPACPPRRCPYLPAPHPSTFLALSSCQVDIDHAARISLADWLAAMADFRSVRCACCAVPASVLSRLGLPVTPPTGVAAGFPLPAALPRHLCTRRPALRCSPRNLRSAPSCKRAGAVFL